MADALELELRNGVLLVEPWDEEGDHEVVTDSGETKKIYLDHVWEEVAGHAFGLVVKKPVSNGDPEVDAYLRLVNEGDLILFTRAAHIKTKLSFEGKDYDLLFVNVVDVQAVVTDWDSEDGGSHRVDGNHANIDSSGGVSDSCL